MTVEQIASQLIKERTEKRDLDYRIQTIIEARDEDLQALEDKRDNIVSHIRDVDTELNRVDDALRTGLFKNINRLTSDMQKLRDAYRGAI
jgi:archaellum component FlaC